ALNQDWLDPSKTTVYGEALKNVMNRTEQQEGKKQQAVAGLRGIFQKLIGQRQQPQLTDDQRQRMAREIESKAPTATAGSNIKDVREAALAALDIEQAAKAARENYNFITSPDGKVWAVNKTNPRDAYVVKDKESGETVAGTPKGKSGLFMVKGLPVGVYHAGQPVVPGQPGWTKADQEVLDAGMHQAGIAQQLKIDPVYADQAGPAPDPADYKKGRSDPAYAEALKKYGKEIQDLRMKDKTAARIAGVKAQLDYGIGQAMDAEGHIYWDLKKNLIGLAPI